MSLKSVMCAALSAIGALAIPQPASAQMTGEQLRSVRLHGLHLSMTPTDVEAIIRSRTDFGEPLGDVHQSEGFDCAQLYPGATKDLYEEDAQPRTPYSYAFDDAEQRTYWIEFTGVPTGAIASEIELHEIGQPGGWAADLAAALRRFGEPSFVRPGEERYDGAEVAGWCDSTDKECDSNYPDGPRLELAFFPKEANGGPNDMLLYTLVEGRKVYEARRTAYSTMAKRAPRAAKALFHRCIQRAEKYEGDDALMRHLLPLMPFGRDSSPPVFKASAVPPGVFTAIGLDARKDFGPGVCFNSMDIIVEVPGCKSYVFVGFRWARRVRDMWIVALYYGGGSLTRRYAAARRLSGGRYEAVWASSSLAGFNKWRKNGAIPMKMPHS